MQQQRSGIDIVVVCGPVQGGGAVYVWRIRIRVLRDEALQGGGVHALRRVGYRRRECRDRKAAQQQRDRPKSHSESSSGTVPLLSANVSTWTPAFSSSVRCT